MSSNTREHFTAWFTNDRSALEGVFTDVTVLPGELIGDATQGDAAWSSGGEPVFHAVTAVTVDADDGDGDRGLEAAAEVLEEAGWRLVGSWQGVTTGATVTVERA